MPHFMEVIDDLQEGISEEEVSRVRDILIKVQDNIKLRTNINHKKR